MVGGILAHPTRQDPPTSTPPDEHPPPRSGTCNGPRIKHDARAVGSHSTMGGWTVAHMAVLSSLALVATRHPGCGYPHRQVRSHKAIYGPCNIPHCYSYSSVHRAIADACASILVDQLALDPLLAQVRQLTDPTIHRAHSATTTDPPLATAPIPLDSFVTRPDLAQRRNFSAHDVIDIFFAPPRPPM